MAKEKETDRLKVVVDNWPKTKHHLVYIPIFIAVIALCVSLYSAYLSRESFIIYHRPYVWANNYSVIVPDKKIMVQLQNTIAFRVYNAPAKIKRLEIRIELNNNVLLSNTDNNIVRYPDDAKTQWSHSFSNEDIKRKILALSDADKAKLVRFVDFEYTALDGGNIYHYKLKQSFDPAENLWKYDNQDAN